MMTIRNRYQEALNEVTVLRDVARLQAHLFSIDARDRWREVERILDSARNDVQKEGEDAAELAVAALRSAAKLGRHLLEQRQKDSKELQAPATQLMNHLPQVCSPNDTISRAAQIMWNVNCGSIPVVGDDHLVVGIITDRDIAMATFTKGKAPEHIQVHESMSPSVVVANEQNTVGEILGIMSTHQIHRIPVTDKKGRLRGIVSMGDIARHIAKGEDADACKGLVRTLAAISSPSRGPESKPT